MGHESQIEPWSPLERRSALLVSELNRLRRQPAMTTAMRESPTSRPMPRAEHRVSPVRAHPAHEASGLEVKKIPAIGVLFFLTSPFIERTFRGNFSIAGDTCRTKFNQWIGDFAAVVREQPSPEVFCIMGYSERVALRKLSGFCLFRLSSVAGLGREASKRSSSALSEVPCALNWFISRECRFPTAISCPL